MSSLSDYAGAEAYHARALRSRRAAGDALGVTRSRHQLGTVARGEGDVVRARELWDEALHIRRTIGEPRGIAVARVSPLPALSGFVPRYDRAVMQSHAGPL